MKKRQREVRQEARFEVAVHDVPVAVRPWLRVWLRRWRRRQERVFWVMDVKDGGWVRV